MPNPAETLSAMFRVTSRLLQDNTQDEAHGQGGLVQERLIIPCNSIMGRHQLGQSSAGLCLRGPGVGRERFFEKNLDYFDNECSKRHCIIELDETLTPRIRDFSSTNGTWLWRPSASKNAQGRWEQLKVGISYRLELHQRIQLGEQSVYEYEFLGLTPNAHIRVRYCSKANDALIHEHDWEWRAIVPDGTPWSTRQMVDPQGHPLHGSPHFSVQVAITSSGSYRANIEYEPWQGKTTSGYIQNSGSAIYGAELVEHDEYGDSEQYQIGYEVLLPGPSEHVTALNASNPRTIPQIFLRSENLSIKVELDSEGWTIKALLFLTRFAELAHQSTEIAFHRARKRRAPSTRFSPDELDADQYYSEQPKSLRHAILCALVKQRLQDQDNATRDPGWISLRQVVGLTDSKELSQREFKNSATTWRIEIAKVLEATAVEVQRRLNQLVGIPQEQDWKSFVEFDTETDNLQLRLHPGILVEKSG